MNVVIVNGCPELVDHQTVQSWVDAVQRQVALDFAPKWNVTAILNYAGDGLSTKPGVFDYIIRLVRSSSQPGTLGSHWFQDGRPTGEVAIQTCIDDGVAPSSCLSHEVLEIVYDPFATLAFQVDRMFQAAEVCDRIEDTDRTYKIDNVLMENFSLSSAFLDTGWPYDFCRKLSNNIIAPTGYQLRVDIGTGQWSQLTGRQARKSKRVAGDHSRRALRMKRTGVKADNLLLVHI